MSLKVGDRVHLKDRHWGDFSKITYKIILMKKNDWYVIQHSEEDEPIVVELEDIKKEV